MPPTGAGHGYRMNRSLSSRTRELIARIYRDRGVWGSLTLTQTDAIVTRVRLVAAQNEPLAVRDLLPLLFVAEQRITEAAAHAIHHLITLIAPRELPWLDEQVRRTHSEWIAPGSAWLELTPVDLFRLTAFGAPAVSLLGLASFHERGFVRQAAVELLAEHSGGAELPFLLLRLNDWVDNVRRVALQTVEARLVPRYAEHFVRNLDLVTRLEQRTRGQHRSVIDGVLTILRTSQNRGALLDIVRSPNRFQRRLGYRLLLEAAQNEAENCLRDAIRDIDPAIRMWAVDRAGEVLTGSNLTDFLSLALRDPLPRVRSQALSVLHQRDPQQAVEQARGALLDASATLRQQARVILRQAGIGEFASFYRRALAHEERSRLRQAALRGLGESGDAADEPLLMAYITDGVPRVREAALWALDKLTGVLNLAEFMKALLDPSPAVSRQAARIVSAYMPRIDPESLWQIFAQTEQTHTRRNVLHLAARLRKWESLPLLLLALDVPVDAVRQLASAYIRSWLADFNRSFSTPRPEQRARLRRLLEPHRFVLGRELYRQLEFVTRE
jgi:HEAT repeat protein